MARYARGKWDFQLAQYGYTKRANKLASTPATIPVSGQKSISKDLAIILNEFWFNFVQDLNPKESKRFITAPRTGWVNEEWTEGSEYPSSESLVMSGNALLIKEVSDNFGLVDAYDFLHDTPDPQTDNFVRTPWKVHKFTVITNRDQIRNPGAGLDAYYPVLRSGGNLWISLDRIEFFPELPMRVTIEVPTIVYQPLETATGRVLPAGMVKEIHDYKLTGSSVWAAIDEGWMPLLLNGIFSPTNWSMETPAPVAAKGTLEAGTGVAIATPDEHGVTITKIRMIVRQSPGGNKVGELVYGRKARVFAQTTHKGVAWLRIGDKRWITKEGTRRI